MDSDNLYPNDGASYNPLSVPIAQALAIDEDIKRTLAGIPILEEEVAYLSERIAFYESVHSIDGDVGTNTDVFMHVFMANKLAADTLTKERDYLLGRIREATKE